MSGQPQQLDLHFIASRLEGMEETIIAKLIDRAQFAANDIAYTPGKSGFTGESHRSLFDLRMLHHEKMDAPFGRFCVPEERPFTGNLPPPQREVTLPDSGLKIDDLEKVNFTGSIKPAYLDLVRQICPAGDDGQYGSSVEHDVYAIQAVSRRIHFGAFYVAESKILAEPEAFRGPIADRDEAAIEALLTRRDVEERIIERIYRKTIETQRGVNRELRNVVDAETIVQFYRDTVIPVTKKGEVAYLLHRSVATSATQSA
jgi:chorismate mutase